MALEQQLEPLVPGVGHCELELETLYLGSKHVRLVFEPVGARLCSCYPLALQTANPSVARRRKCCACVRARVHVDGCWRGACTCS